MVTGNGLPWHFPTRGLKQLQKVQVKRAVSSPVVSTRVVQGGCLVEGKGCLFPQGGLVYTSGMRYEAPIECWKKRMFFFGGVSRDI